MKYYGTVSYDTENKKYVIECEPHVTMRLKRVFGKLGDFSQGKHRISANEDNARDLLWFMDRYPLQMEPDQLKMLNFLSDQSKQTEQFIEKFYTEKFKVMVAPLAVPAYDFQNEAATMILRMRGLLLGDDVGLGKAQPLDSKVLTPIGWKRMGDLQIGDFIIDPDGGKSCITGIYPQGIKDIYQVKTVDGEIAECCNDHLWLLETANDRRRNTQRVLALRNFKDKLSRPHGRSKWKTSNYFLPLTKPITYFEKTEPLPIHPYLLGVLLGDGSLKKNQVLFTTKDDYILDKVRRLLPTNNYLIKCKDSEYDYRISGILHNHIRNPIVKTLRELGLTNKKSNNKFIPDVYMFAFPFERLELLKGLMDTDGTCSITKKKGNATATFTTISKELSEQVRELVNGLGGFSSIYSRIPTYTYKGKKLKGKLAYTLNIRLSVNPFSLPRKVERWRMPNMARSIKSVTLIGQKECQCISTSSKRQLYITDGYIVTHNTVSFIATLTQRETLPAVVVPLAHLPQQWKEMINRFAPHLRVHIVKTKSIYKIKPHDVYIVNYHKLSGWAETFSKIAKTVCFDECQELRRRESAKYSAAKHLSENTEYRIGLSATPIYNYGGEMFNVMNILTPGKLGTAQEFEREWCNTIYGKSTLKDPVAFGNYLRNNGMMLRRTRKEVKREIPQVQIFNQYVDADLHAIQEVESNCLELAQFILSGTEVNRGDKMRASEEFDMRLRQATGIAKAPHVADFVKILIENGEKVLLFGWHRAVYDIWLKRLFDVSPVMYTGSESPKQKQDAKDSFINGDSKLLIMSLRSGAGIDGLQSVCKTVVNGELDWSPGVHEQNLGRVARDGQESPVIGYNLISEHGSDPVIADILGLKKNQVEGIRNPDKPLVEKLQADPLHIKKLAQQYLENHLKKG